MPDNYILNNIQTPIGLETPLWAQGLLLLLGAGIPLFFLLILGLKLIVNNLRSIGNYVKYNNWFNDVKNKKVGKYWNKESFIYVKEKDEYICPNGERLVFKEVTEKATSTGFIQKLYKYQCVNCSGCEMRELCTKGNGNRSLEVNKLLEEHKRIVRRNLCSEEGTALRKQRCADVEATFGIIKGNGCFRRFLLRSLAKVKVEWGLISLAHNMKKLWALISKSAK